MNSPFDLNAHPQLAVYSGNKIMHYCTNNLYYLGFYGLAMQLSTDLSAFDLHTHSIGSSGNKIIHYCLNNSCYLEFCDPLAQSNTNLPAFDPHAWSVEFSGNKICIITQIIHIV